MRLLRAMGSAFTLMTALPLRQRGEVLAGPDVAAFFPWVGWLIGGVAIVAAEVVRSASAVWGSDAVLGRGGYLIGALIVAATALATRMLHWDGLSDTADALWGGGDVERRLAIMSDSATGAFGATAVALVAITQVVASGAVFQAPAVLGYAVFAAPVFSRTSATFAAWLGRPLRDSGLGAGLMGRPSIGAVVAALLGAALPVAVVWYGHESVGLLWSVAAILTAAIVPHLLGRAIGGVNGDVMGASVLVSETLMLCYAGLVSAA